MYSLSHWLQLQELEDGRNDYFYFHFGACSIGVEREQRPKGVVQLKSVVTRSWEWLLSFPPPPLGKARVDGCAGL